MITLSDIKLPGIGNVPKPAVIAVGAASAAIIVYAYWKHTQHGGGSPTDAPTASPDSSIDPATGVPYADEGGGYGTPGGGNGGGWAFPGVWDPTTGTYIGRGVGGTVLQVTTNAAWAQACLSYLVTVGGYQDSQAVGNALGAGLLGHYMTPDMVSIWNAAVAFEGQPPQGHPPLNITPPVTPPATGKLAAPTGLRMTESTRTSVHLQWNAVVGASHYRAYDNVSGYNVADASSPAVWIGGLKPNTSYKFHVAALDSRNAIGKPSVTITGKTKK